MAIAQASNQSSPSPLQRCAENIALLHGLQKVLPASGHETPTDDDDDESTDSVVIYGSEHPRSRPRLIPADMEETLVKSLAYLSSTDVESDHVTAVAIEEIEQQETHTYNSGDGDTRSLRVLVAINKTKPQDNQTVLDTIVDAFRGLFAAMNRLSDETHNRILEDIVGLCRRKIMYRLGLDVDAGRSKTRPFLGSQLQEAVDAFQRRPGAHLEGDDGDKPLQRFVHHSTALLAKLDSLDLRAPAAARPSSPSSSSSRRSSRQSSRSGAGESVPMDRVKLRRAVWAIYHYMAELKRTDTDIEHIVGLLENREMGPCTRDGMVRRLRELARFCEVANLLLRHAREAARGDTATAAWLRAITVEPILLSARDFASLKTGRSTPDTPLQPCLARFGWNTGRLNALVKRLDKNGSRSNNNGSSSNSNSNSNRNRNNNSSSNSNSNNSHASTPFQDFSRFFQSQCSKALSTQAKIHAEIQIAYYLDSKATASDHGHFIVSCKDACYLCHAFLQAHGGFQVPPTHGQLYPGWRLPSLAPSRGCSSFDEALDQLNDSLERDIRQALDTLRRTKPSDARGRGVAPPNESPLYAMPPSTLSLAAESTSPPSSVVTLRRSTSTGLTSVADMPRKEALPVREEPVEEDKEHDGGRAGGAASTPVLEEPVEEDKEHDGGRAGGAASTPVLEEPVEEDKEHDGGRAGEAASTPVLSAESTPTGHDEEEDEPEQPRAAGSDHTHDEGHDDEDADPPGGAVDPDSSADDGDSDSDSDSDSGESVATIRPRAASRARSPRRPPAENKAAKDTRHPDKDDDPSSAVFHRRRSEHHIFATDQLELFIEFASAGEGGGRGRTGDTADTQGADRGDKQRARPRRPPVQSVRLQRLAPEEALAAQVVARAHPNQASLFDLASLLAGEEVPIHPGGGTTGPAVYLRGNGADVFRVVLSE